MLKMLQAKLKQEVEGQPAEQEKDEVYLKAKEKVVVVKEQIDKLINQFFNEKMDKVRSNEKMIVSSMYEPKLKVAK